MDTRLTTTHGLWRLLIAASVVLALVMALGATSGTAASPDCRVKSTDTGKTYQTLQAAVDAARKGDRLTFRGTCHGGTVIDKSVVIEGVATPASGKAALDGDGVTRVLLIEAGIRVTLRSLVIRDGLADEPRWNLEPWRRRGGRGPGCANGLTCGRGGGIHSTGSLVLRDVVVRDNKAGYAGGGIHNGGTLTLEGRSRIRGNSATGGGGVHNNGTLTLRGRSAITGNRARVYGGGVYGGHGGRSIIRLNDDSHISGNWSGSRGGGVNIDAEYGGTLTLDDRSHVSHNTGGPGGGVASYGTVTLNDSSHISGNTSRDVGGGIEGGIVRLNASSHISGNTARGQGGGFAGGTVTLNDSSHISDNRARGAGGGFWAPGAGTLTMNDESTISANQVAFLDELEPGVGGGVANGGGVFLHHSSVITGNSAERGGGGVYSFSGGTLTGVSCAPHTYANVYGNTPDDCFIESR